VPNKIESLCHLDDHLGGETPTYSEQNLPEVRHRIADDENWWTYAGFIKTMNRSSSIYFFVDVIAKYIGFAYY
jgi:hypothetical protein